MPSAEYLKLRKDGIKDMHNTELLKACKENRELLGEFLKENKDFIFSIIMTFKGNIEELKTKFKVTEEELLQHAYIGVITALREFDFDRGIKFTTYVVRPILWEINQLLYNDSQPVRLSRGAIDLIKKMAEIEDTLGYRPSEEEMAYLLNISVDRYREIARFSNELEHYDGIENFDISDSPERDLVEEITDKVYVHQLLNDPIFTDFEKKVMKMVMEEENFAQIAEKLNVYPMTINRTLARIRSKILNKEYGIKENKLQIISKYEKEINLVMKTIKEKERIISIKEMREIFEEHGIDHSKYTNRILYYIRQKAVQRLGN